MLARRYWPAWNAAFRAAWENDRGGVRPRALREEPADASMPGPAEIERIADRLRGCCRLDADHLRHACHVRALGRDKSSTMLSAHEVDRVVLLFRLLANPMELDAVNRWLNPDLDARERIEWRLSHFPLPEEYVAKVCVDRFGRRDWKGLKTEQLRALLLTLEERRRSRARAAASTFTSTSTAHA